MDQFDSIIEWLIALRNYIELPNIDLNKERKDLINMVDSIIEEIEELE